MEFSGYIPVPANELRPKCEAILNAEAAALAERYREWAQHLMDEENAKRRSRNRLRKLFFLDPLKPMTFAESMQRIREDRFFLSIHSYPSAWAEARIASASKSIYSQIQELFDSIEPDSTRQIYVKSSIYSFILQREQQ